MGSSWSGFHAQNKVIKLQWVALEASQSETAMRALGGFLSQQATDTESEEDKKAEDNILTALLAQLYEPSS
jgi:hypothetical protein